MPWPRLKRMASTQRIEKFVFMRELVDAMVADAGVALPELRVDGGMTANDLLLQIQADVLGLPVVRPAVIETTALGAAYAAGLAVGFWESLDELRASRAASAPGTPSATDERARARLPHLERGGRALARLGREVSTQSSRVNPRAGPRPADPHWGGRMVDSQRKLAAEFVGTFALIFFGAGSALRGGRPGRPGTRERPRDRPHGDGGRAHLRRALQPRRDALDARHRAASRPARPARYWVCQLAGAVAAALAAARRSSRRPSRTPPTSASRRSAATASARSTRSWPRSSARSSSSSSSTASPSTSAVRSASSRACPSASRSASACSRVGVISGAAFNPARWFGPALVSGSFDNFWIWILGPAIGALLAGFAYDRLLLKGTPGE